MGGTIPESSSNNRITREEDETRLVSVPRIEKCLARDLQLLALIQLNVDNVVL